MWKQINITHTQIIQVKIWKIVKCMSTHRLNSINKPTNHSISHRHTSVSYQRIWMILRVRCIHRTHKVHNVNWVCYFWFWFVYVYACEWFLFLQVSQLNASLKWYLYKKRKKSCIWRNGNKKILISVFPS